MSVQYYEGIGRRKESTARVRVMSGSGNFTVNEKTLLDYFNRKGDMESINLPFGAINSESTGFDVTVKVEGGV